MIRVTPTPDGFTVDAEIIGNGFGLDPEQVPGLMRTGQITSRSETGVDADAGRFRLTFFYAGRSLRLTVDPQGRILSRSSFDSPIRPDTATTR
ncbi:DUF6522 family protein [Sedimentitalea nanhaiensis]|uniref:Uncharacterized protein n=1 Tax=Sedimentitalea nanhaiensis TaxID=999627 RepID=A0A1I7CIC8_9RHOB|nr:DUF6522 family protein [Sedimentitalea nanhaiensis]SFT99180.1 hypothetical protein SAMN05216236_1175 [Sedimentitalea nanhaiensis]